MKKVSKEIENLAVQKLKSGLSLREIGRELNISYCLVYKIKKAKRYRGEMQQKWTQENFHYSRSENNF